MQSVHTMGYFVNKRNGRMCQQTSYMGKVITETRLYMIPEEAYRMQISGCQGRNWDARRQCTVIANCVSQLSILG